MPLRVRRVRLYGREKQNANWKAKNWNVPRLSIDLAGALVYLYINLCQSAIPTLVLSRKRCHVSIKWSKGLYPDPFVWPNCGMHQTKHPIDNRRLEIECIGFKIK